MRENGWEKTKFLIDGFPRNAENYDGFYEVFGDEADVKGVLFLDLSEEKMMERIQKRAEQAGEGNQRADDNVESIKKRFKTFQDETMPVVETFKSKNMCFYVSSDNTIEGVAADVRACVDKLLTPSTELNKVPVPLNLEEHLKKEELEKLNAVEIPDKPIVVFALGGSGAGKSTQCQMIVANYGFIHLCVGDLLNAERIREESPHSVKIEECLKNGDLVPHDITHDILRKAMKVEGWTNSKF